MPAVSASSCFLDPSEGPGRPFSPAQHGDLQVARGQGRRSGPGQRLESAALSAVAEVPVRPRQRRGDALGDGLGVPAEHGEAVLVGDRSLVGDVVQLVGLAVAQLGHQDLHLERLHLVGEDVAEVLGVEIGQRARVDVLAAERVALGVGVAHPGDTQLVVLVVLAHSGEGDAVVDLADLVERPRRVLGDDERCRRRRSWPRATGPGRCPSGRTRPGPSSPARARRRRAWSWAPPLRPACGRSSDAEALGDLALGDLAVALGVDHGDERVDPAHQVRAPGGGVLVGGLVEGLDGQVDRLGPGQSLPPTELDGVARVTAARTRWPGSRSPRSGRR